MRHLSPDHHPMKLKLLWKSQEACGAAEGGLVIDRIKKNITESQTNCKFLFRQP